MLPVIPVPADRRDHEGKQCQQHGNRNAPRDIGPPGENRDQPHHVIEPDEKEYGQQEGHEAFILVLSYRRLGNVITNK